MSFTYDPSSSGLSYVRLRVGDTSSGSARLSDEEITTLLSVAGNRTIAAALAAESIAGKFSRSVDKTVGRLSLSLGKASQSYFDLARRLRLEANLQAAPYAGGLSESEKDSDIADSDLVRPAFRRGEFDDLVVLDASTGD